MAKGQEREDEEGIAEAKDGEDGDETAHEDERRRRRTEAK